MNLEMGNKSYDFLNALVRIVLPAMAACYLAIALIWGLPYPVEIGGTLAAIATFGGLVIQVARKGWKVDDELLVHEGVEGTSFGFASGQRLEDLKTDQLMTLRVKPVSEEELEVLGRRFA